MKTKATLIYQSLTLNSVRLRYKLPLIMVLLAVAASAGVGFSAYTTVADYLSKSVSSRLVTTAGSEASAVSRRWSQIEAEVHVQSTNAFASQAIDELSKWMEIGEGDRTQIVSHYTGDGKLDAEGRLAQTGRNHRHGYSWRHGPAHETFSTVLKKFGYSDIYLISKKGRVIYSATKGPEFGELIESSALSDTGLARAVSAAMKLEVGQRKVVDFSAYKPANNEMRAFIAQPVHEAEEHATNVTEKKLTGILVVAVDLSIVDSVLAQTKATGASGRSLVVGQDGILRSAHLASEQEFLPSDMKAAFSAKSGESFALLNRSGVQFVGAAQPLPLIKDAPWTILTVENSASAFGLIGIVRNSIIMASGIVILPLLLVAVWVGFSIAKPVSRLANALKSIAGGRTEEAIPARERRDEIGAIAHAVHLIRENMAASNLEREQEQASHANDAALQRQQILSELANELDKTVGSIATAVSAAAEELNATARELDNGASETRSSADAMSAATSRVVHNMQGIDSSAVALRNAVDEIDHEVRHAESVAETARVKAQSTEQIVHMLDEGAKRVSDVVGLISNIAEQTNLLALNATIEAARAGNAGRGFAVVAAEVKQLANQTAKATDEIARQINLMNDATRNSVQAIGDIQAAIAELSGVTRRTALTVSQQKEASRAIVDDVNTVSHEMADISAGTSQVGAASGQTFQSAQAVLSAASELTQQASDLHMRVEHFIARVRTA